MNTINHPPHYGGDTPTEPIKVIEAWGLNFHLGNAVKYIARAGKKGSEEEDLRKAVWYIQRHLDRLVGFADVDEKVSARDFEDFGEFVDNFLYPNKEREPAETGAPEHNDLKTQYVAKVNELFQDQRVRDLLISYFDLWEKYGCAERAIVQSNQERFIGKLTNTGTNEGYKFWNDVYNSPDPEAKIKELKGWD